MIKFKDKGIDIEKIYVVKKYFTRIFTVLSKDVREGLHDLSLSKEEKKHVKKELAFLPEQKQLEYLNELKRKQKSIT